MGTDNKTPQQVPLTGQKQPEGQAANASGNVDTKPQDAGDKQKTEQPSTQAPKKS